MLTRQISSEFVSYVFFDGRKPQVWPYFQIWHSVMAPTSGAERKLNAGAPLQTFPYRNLPKPFLHSNPSWRSR